MATDYGLLFNVPQQQVSPIATGALQGVKDYSAYQGQQALIANQELDNQTKRLTTRQNLLAGVAFAPPDEQPGVYNATLKQMDQAKLDTSGLPTQWGPDAEAAVNASYYTSGNALARLKAEAELRMTGVNLTANAAKANDAAAHAGQPVPFPTLPGFTTLMGGPGAQQAAPGASPTQGGAPANGTMVAPGANGSAAVVGAPSTGQLPRPYGPTELQSPAELKADEAKGQAWNDWKTSLATADQGYISNKQTLDQIEPLIDQVVTGPGIGKTTGIVGNGQQLNVLGKALNLQYTGQFTKTGGISRLDIPLVKAIQFLAPDTEKYPASNHLEVNRIRLADELGHSMAQLAPVLDGLGVRDQDSAIQMFNKAVLATNSIDQKTGKINFDKFGTWYQYLPPAAKQAFMAAHPEMIKPEMNSQFTLPNGKTGTYEQIIDAAQAKNMPVDAYMKAIQAKGVTPVQSQQNAPNNVAAQHVGNILAQSVVPMESGGNYAALGSPQKNGDRAVGKYQVMASNVRPWTKEVLGVAMTPAEFRNNPQAQDAVARAKLGQYYQQSSAKDPTGKAADALAMWHAGKPMGKITYNTMDSNGTRTFDYVRRGLNNAEQIVTKNKSLAIPQSQQAATA